MSLPLDVELLPNDNKRYTRTESERYLLAFLLNRIEYQTLWKVSGFIISRY